MCVFIAKWVDTSEPMEMHKWGASSIAQCIIGKPAKFFLDGGSHHCYIRTARVLPYIKSSVCYLLTKILGLTLTCSLSAEFDTHKVKYCPSSGASEQPKWSSKVRNLHCQWSLKVWEQGVTDFHVLQTPHRYRAHKKSNMKANIFVKKTCQ
jgi:hypothetical protein